jgi:hypothetical protein
MLAISAKGIALVLLRRIEEGTKLLAENDRQSRVEGNLYNASSHEPFFGLSKILQGNIREGIRTIEEAVVKRDEEGSLTLGDFAASILSEVHLQIISGKEKPPLVVLLRNLPVLLNVMFTGPSRGHALFVRVLKNPYYDPDGHYIGQAHMLHGLFDKAKKKRASALEHLTEAKRILSQFGQSPILARVETALAELRQ